MANLAPSLILDLQKGRLAICRLAPDLPVPTWASGTAAFLSITRTRQELSIVCPESLVPPAVRQERGLRLIRVAGPLDFSLVGILEALANPLAQAGISIFALSTYDTDYLLVKEDRVDEATAVLTRAGHQVRIE